MPKPSSSKTNAKRPSKPAKAKPKAAVKAAKKPAAKSSAPKASAKKPVQKKAPQKKAPQKKAPASKVSKKKSPVAKTPVKAPPKAVAVAKASKQTKASKAKAPISKVVVTRVAQPQFTPSSKTTAIANKNTFTNHILPTFDPKADANLKPFLRKQKEKLLYLRDAIVDSMMGVAKDNLRSRAEGSEASAFGMHQADAGSDSYDRDFALNLLSQEQDALYEIDQALKRVELGTYGVCEVSEKPIPHARLEAIPFARCTVECQTEIERQNRGMRARRPVVSLFGLSEEEGGDGEEEESSSDSKD